MANTNPFRILDLPAELRLMIYEYTFSDSAPQELDLLNIQEHHPLCDLLQTSRQVYQEARQTYKQAVQHFSHDRNYYLQIPYDCVRAEYMKPLCRRLARHRLNDQNTITLRFVGLGGYGPDEYASLHLSLNAHGVLLAGSRHRAGKVVPVQILHMAGGFMGMRARGLQCLNDRNDRIDCRVVMVYLAATLMNDPMMRKMWREGVGS